MKTVKFASTYLTVKVDMTRGKDSSVPSRDWQMVNLDRPPLPKPTTIESHRMSKPTLRVFKSDTNSNQRQRELDRISGTAEARTVAVPLGKIVPLLIDAGKHHRAWLNDFADDLIRIDADLYDVLLAYQELQRRDVA